MLYFYTDFLLFKTQYIESLKTEEPIMIKGKIHVEFLMSVLQLEWNEYIVKFQI